MGAERTFAPEARGSFRIAPRAIGCLLSGSVRCSCVSTGLLDYSCLRLVASAGQRLIGAHCPLHPLNRAATNAGQAGDLQNAMVLHFSQLARIAANWHEVLRLRFAQGLSPRAIGISLRLSTGAANKYLDRACRSDAFLRCALPKVVAERRSNGRLSFVDLHLGFGGVGRVLGDGATPGVVRVLFKAQRGGRGGAGMRCAGNGYGSLAGRQPSLGA